MSLFIEVYVGSKSNKKLVARTHAYNVSDLADVSDYEFISEEFGAKHLDIPATEVKGTIKNHNRKQSVWKLVNKIVKLNLSYSEQWGTGISDKNQIKKLGEISESN